MADYIVSRNGQQKTYNEDQFKLLIQTNRLHGSDLVWQAGWDDWKSIDHVLTTLNDSPSLNQQYNDILRPPNASTNSVRPSSRLSVAPNNNAAGITVIFVILIIVGHFICYLFNIPTLLTPVFSLIHHVTAKDVFIEYVNLPGNEIYRDDFVYQGGSIVKQGHIGIAGTVSGESPAYLAKVIFKEPQGKSDELYIFYAVMNDGTKQVEWRGTENLQDVVDMMQQENFH